MRAVFLGDSLTEGVDGTSYLRLLGERIEREGLAPQIELINAGAGGDTVINLARRVALDVVPRQPDWVVVFIGVNDCTTALLHRSLPIPSTIAGLRYFRYQKQVRGAVTTQRFRDGLRTLVDMLATRTTAQVALCTPATIGESPRARGWRWLDRYAEITRLVAAERDCALIDVRAAFVQAVAGLPPRPALAALGGLRARFVAPGDYERMARLRGLRLTYDGIHMTRRGATLIADAMYAWLRDVAEQQAASAAQ
jgi:lysophospholipase L1-like esterase